MAAEKGNASPFEAPTEFSAHGQAPRYPADRRLSKPKMPFSRLKKAHSYPGTKREWSHEERAKANPELFAAFAEFLAEKVFSNHRFKDEDSSDKTPGIGLSKAQMDEMLKDVERRYRGKVIQRQNEAEQQEIEDLREELEEYRGLNDELHWQKASLARKKKQTELDSAVLVQEMRHELNQALWFKKILMKSNSKLKNELNDMKNKTVEMEAEIVNLKQELKDDPSNQAQARYEHIAAHYRLLSRERGNPKKIAKMEAEIKRLRKECEERRYDASGLKEDKQTALKIIENREARIEELELLPHLPKFVGRERRERALKHLRRIREKQESRHLEVDKELDQAKATIEIRELDIAGKTRRKAR